MYFVIDNMHIKLMKSMVFQLIGCWHDHEVW